MRLLTYLLSTWLCAAVTCCSGGGSSAQGSPDGSAGLGASCGACDDGIACTIDSCESTGCRHTIGPSSGATACPPLHYCTVASGCVANPACATDSQCITAFSGDACKIDVRCDAVSAVCVFALLDKDGDGHTPPVCGGDDCDDSSAVRFPTAIELCDGIDQNCNGAVDEQCTCSGATEHCGTSCIDTSADKQHCGGCDRSCPPGASCASGTCDCGLGHAVCDGACINIASDAANCGGCAKKCSASESCCGGACVDFRTKAANCGSCGHPCTSIELCQDRVCTVNPDSQCGSSTCTGVTLPDGLLLRGCCPLGATNPACGRDLGDLAIRLVGALPTEPCAPVNGPGALDASCPTACLPGVGMPGCCRPSGECGYLVEGAGVGCASAAKVGVGIGASCT